jgi:cell division protein FtsQ
VGYAAVTHTDYFRIEAIKVSGLSRLTEAAIVTQAKIRTGDNLLAVNLGLVCKRLLAHPWIATARVAREIPGTIRIEITENQALAVLDLGRKFLINTNGRVFKERSPDDPQKLPLVSGITYADMSLGEDALSPAMTAVVQVLQTSQAQNSAIPYAQIQEVSMDPGMGIALTAWPDQRRIKLGFAPFESKYQRIKQLLPYLRRSSTWQGFDTIDANNPDRIVVQLGSPLQKGA